MTFNDDAGLDTSQVGGGGRGFPGGGLAVGGGGLGIVGLIIYLVISALGGGDPGGGGLPSQLQPGQDGSVSADEIASECRTGADANERIDCRIVGYTNSVQDYWKKAFGSKNGGYQVTRTILFQGGVQTGCGNATSEVGPFYCPTDGLVYMDVGFFDELSSRFGAKGGPLAQAYVVAHEYGHHVQNLLGVSEKDHRAGERVGAARVAGRLLRRRLDQEREQHHRRAGPHADQSAHRAGDRGRAGRRRRGRRRPDPAAYAGPGQSGGLDARVVGAAAAVVPDRLPVRQPQLLRHLQRRHLTAAPLDVAVGYLRRLDVELSIARTDQERPPLS